MHRKLAFGLMLLSGAVLASPPAWTNIAGQVIEAEPLRIGITAITFSGEPAKRYPRSIFPTNEVARMMQHLQIVAIPPALLPAQRRALHTIARARLLHSEGILDDAALEERRKRAEKILESRINRHYGTPLTEEAKAVKAALLRAL